MDEAFLLGAGNYLRKFGYANKREIFLRHLKRVASIAKKYDLDLQKDKDLIKQIKKEQTLWTLTGLLPGAGPLVAYIVVNCLNSDKIEVD